MTTPADTAGPQDPAARDELASAYLDGATTAEENAVVERDVDLLRRVEALAAVRDRLAVPAQPGPAADAHRAAALAAFDELGAESVAGASAGATVSDLAARRRRWTERVPLGAVAAAVAVLALVVGVTRIDLDADSDDMATGAALEDSGDSASAGGSVELDGRAEFDASDDAGDFDSGAPTAGSTGAGGEAPATDSAELYADRRSYDDLDGLAAALRGRLDGTDPSEPDTGESDPAGDDAATRSSDPCDAVALVGADPDSVRVVESALIAGDPVTAVVFLDDADTDRLAVVDDANCSIRTERPL